MRTWLSLPVLAFVSVALGGCDLYFGNGDDDPCANVKGTGGGAAYPYYEYRDPTTGTCVGYGGGGYYPCDSACGPCPVYEDAGGATAAPDMALCQSACTGLDEYTCQATPGCYAAFNDYLNGDSLGEYAGCWQTAPSGPIQGTCVGLDAQACSRHDDCELHYAAGAAGTKFYSCEQEEGFHGCAATDCGPGYHCEEQCYPSDLPSGPNMGYCTATCVPDGTTCAAVDCAPGYTCVDACDYDSNGNLTCSPSCVPTGTDPGSCYGQVLCDAAPPACPSGTTAGIANGCYTGYCIPNADCGPHDPGECYGTVTCGQLAPSCPSNTTPGILNGCYTGYCIPTTACPAPACESLSSEAACTARGDCTPVYAGTGCTCDVNGCTCQTLTFARCETAGVMPL